MSMDLYRVKYTSFEDLVILQDLYTFFEDFNKIPFDLTNGQSIVNAYWMAELCRLVYFNDVAFIREKLSKVNLDVEVFFKDDTEIMVCYDDEKMFIVCRGTESSSSKDIITNLNFFRTKSVMVGNVHGGFQKALNVVWSDLSDFIQKHRKNKYVYITGHSLGAGIASLVASRIPANGLYTFGSPRVGNIQFALGMEMKMHHYRFVTQGDPIPSLPPPLLSWSHFGYLVEIESNIYLYNKEEKIIEKISKTFKSRQKYLVVFALLFFGYTFARRLFLDLAADHNILSYCFSFRRTLKIPPQTLDRDLIK